MKHLNYILLSLFLVTSLFGCSDKTNDNKANSANFSISKQVISNDDTLEISLPKKHPSKLSIIAPDKQLFIIYSPEDNITFVAYEDKIKLPISTLKGITWIDGKKSEQLVFKKPGKYTVYMADNLETEPENTFHFKQSLELK